MQPSDTTVAFQLLAVTATLLPLVAVFLQLLLRVQDENETTGERGAAGAYFAVVALLAFGAGGYVAADVIKFGNHSQRIGWVANLLQFGILSLLAAVLIISTDIFSIFGWSVEVPYVDAIWEAVAGSSDEATGTAKGDGTQSEGTEEDD